jgi:cyclic pyranopterin phosphate synthase
MLSFEEFLRLCRILGGLGIRKIKVTGGEPLVRRGCATLIAALKSLPGIEQVTLTTNGFLLEEELPRLAAAGLDGINISLDTLDEETFRRLTRRSGVDKVLRALRAALEAGIPVKVNCVPLRGINEKELPDLAALARDQPVAVRFIELMPLGRAVKLDPLTGGETAAALEGRFGKLTPWKGRLGNGPARYYVPSGFTGTLGFIDPVSQSFCGSCNRLRLTSQGRLKPCLAEDLDLDLRTPLRGGASDDDLAEAILNLAARKPGGHHFLTGGGTPGQPQEMFRIGG